MRLCSTLGPAREIQKWSGVSGAELEKEAKKQTGTAASVDGWSGDEVASFPLLIWDRIAMFFRDCERLGSAPEQFGFVRQAHIPKEGKGVREHDGALHAAAMRPITILTALWRVWGRASLTSGETARWLETWMTPEISGGRRGVDALSSVIKILEAASSGKYVATFDYSLAFDFTNPAMAVEIIRWLGMPAGTAGLLKSVWQSQKRTLQYAGESLRTEEPVMTSLPQGDPWSMIAMAAVLLIPLCDLREAIPNTDILLYLDDRSWASQSAQDCVKFGKKWKAWSSRLGLKENATKEKYYHENPIKAVQDFVIEGVQAKAIDPNLALLGVELAPRGGRELTNKEAARLESARKIALKCQCLPGAAARNLLIASMKATPKAAYGWFCGSTSEATFRQVDRAIAQVGPDPKMGDASLKTLLRGHMASAFFMSGFQLVMAAWRRALKQGAANGEWREHGWTRNLRNFMKSIGCKETTSWRWCTSQDCTIDLNPESDEFDETSGLMAHRIREAWRKTLFDRWKVRARIDAKLCVTQT